MSSEICIYNIVNNKFEFVDITDFEHPLDSFHTFHVGGKRVKWGDNPATIVGSESQIYIWRFRNDGNRKFGRDIAKSTHKALQQLRELGIEPIETNIPLDTPSKDVPQYLRCGFCMAMRDENDEYGYIKTASDEEMWRIVAFNLKRLNYTARKYPDCYFCDSYDTPRMV